MKKIIVFSTVLVIIFTLSFSSFAITIPEPTNDFFVNDFADVISEENEAEIMKIGADLYEQTTAQIVVVTVESLDGYEVNDYALELGREWGVGSDDTNNGVVLLLSVSDRKVTIQVGYGLEGCLTDAGTGRILDNYAIPYLRNDDFSTGLTESYKAIVSEVCTEYGVELNPDYHIDYYNTSDDYYSDDGIDSDSVATIYVTIFIIIFVIIIFRKFGNNSGDGGSSGRSGHYRGTTFYGGFSGGSRGGFSGGGGGFRGGGGSFGGGGSSRGF